MNLADVNVLLAAHRSGHQHHAQCLAWLSHEITLPAFAIAPAVLSSVIRVATNRRIFADPSPLVEALRFSEGLMDASNAVRIDPGERHWSIFTDLLRKTQLSGNDVPDAWFAALAIESGCTWVTMDQGFKRFPRLSVRTP
ncbi:MAG: PIN domain-containing protein [Hyphomonadaceae bacterium]|nr:PIN domain-containing protein [Hyphomonadaceae bacterium]